MIAKHIIYFFYDSVPQIVGISIIFVIIILVFYMYRTKKNCELKTGTKKKAHGIIFGKKGNRLVYSPTDYEGSVGIFSSSGTGKTAACTIPTLQSWNGTSYVIDISSDILRNCPNMPNKLIFAPESCETVPFNIFGSIDALECVDDQNEALEQLAFLLIPDTATNDNAKFFADGGRKILTAALIAYYHKGLDFIEIVAEEIVKKSWEELFESIEQTKDSIAIMYLSSFSGTNSANTAGCKQTCDDALKLFATNAKVKKSIHRPVNENVAIQPKMIENHNIFVVVDDPKLTLYSPLLNIITSQMMQYISNRKVNSNSNTILLCLDEYASLKLEANMILEALRKYRKRKCRVMIMTQNLADLNILYGSDTTKAILSNLKFKVLLGGLGETGSQKLFSELLGYKESTKEWKIDPSELDRQGKDIAILIASDIPDGYMKLKKNYYFKH